MSTRFVANSMTDVSRMFLLFSGRYISVPHAEGRQHGVSIQLQSSINMGNIVNENICHTKSLSDMNLCKNVCRFMSFHLL